MTLRFLGIVLILATGAGCARELPRAGDDVASGTNELTRTGGIIGAAEPGLHSDLQRALGEPDAPSAPAGVEGLLRVVSGEGIDEVTFRGTTWAVQRDFADETSLVLRFGGDADEDGRDAQAVFAAMTGVETDEILTHLGMDFVRTSPNGRISCREVVGVGPNRFSCVIKKITLIRNATAERNETPEE